LDRARLRHYDIMSFDSVFRAGLFTGQTHIVTGGGTGIGRCTAHELAALGATVALVGRRLEKLQIVQQEIVESGGRAHVFGCDHRDEGRVQEVVREVIGTTGRVDGLVNNAGGQFASPLAAISKKGWDAVVANNLTGGFLFAREVYLQWMREQGGVIVNIVADNWGSMVGMGHSGAARAGMVNLTETAAVEWAPSGVRVNAVAPGWIASSGFETYPDWMQPYLQELHRAIPLQRLGTESEVSAAIVFLLSPAAAFISGSVLRVDGAAPNARLSSPLSALKEADTATPLPWPLDLHDRSTPWNGFPLRRSSGRWGKGND
jgi:citronellol/citronellal dehydrogenase